MSKNTQGEHAIIWCTPYSHPPSHRRKWEEWDAWTWDAMHGMSTKQSCMPISSIKQLCSSQEFLNMQTLHFDDFIMLKMNHIST
jgi:hypothetical protein